MIRRAGKRNMFGIVLVVTSIVAVGVLAFYVLSSSSSTAIADNSIMAVASASTTAGKTGKSDQQQRETGPSGLPVPRFVSLKRSKVNVRRGPSSEHKIAWVFHLKGLPVEIVAEFEHWRRVRDSDGQEGWIYQTLLTGKRTVTVAPWRKGTAIELRESPTPSAGLVAKVSAGAVGNVAKCTGTWCQIDLNGYKGWMIQSMLWGVYPNEKL